MENHQDGSDRSRDRGEGHGHLYPLYETFLSHWNEAFEDVEGSRESSESLVASALADSSPNIFHVG